MGFFGGMGRKMGFFFQKVEKWGASPDIDGVFCIFVFSVQNSIIVPVEYIPASTYPVAIVPHHTSYIKYTEVYVPVTSLL